MTWSTSLRPTVGPSRAAYSSQRLVYTSTLVSGEMDLLGSKSNQHLGSISDVMVGLLGSYSNPEIQGRLRRLSEKLERLAASDAVPRPSGRQDQRLRGGLVPKAIERVLTDSSEPMRARDIHAEVEELLGRSVPVSSVKNWLATSAQDNQARVVRLGRGRYQLVLS